MNAALSAIHFIAGFIVLAEALNKLERTSPLASGIARYDRWLETLKAVAWALLAVGAAGALAGPLMGPLNIHTPVSEAHLRKLADISVLVGFAVLVIRTRVKEG